MASVSVGDPFSNSPLIPNFAEGQIWFFFLPLSLSKGNQKLKSERKTGNGAFLPLQAILNPQRQHMLSLSKLQKTHWGDQSYSKWMKAQVDQSGSVQVQVTHAEPDPQNNMDKQVFWDYVKWVQDINLLVFLFSFSTISILGELQGTNALETWGGAVTLPCCHLKKGFAHFWSHFWDLTRTVKDLGGYHGLTGPRRPSEALKMANNCIYIFRWKPEMSLFRQSNTWQSCVPKWLWAQPTIGF